MGQINLVRAALPYIADNGCLSGVLPRIHPDPSCSSRAGILAGDRQSHHGPHPEAAQDPQLIQTNTSRAECAGGSAHSRPHRESGRPSSQHSNLRLPSVLNTPGLGKRPDSFVSIEAVNEF
jgi:hypothetical protein